MSLGKLQAALVQFTQETTLAKLADFNFDFTLVRVEAPSEYKGLGAALTSKRRSNAESGSTHVIARKLGALFHSMLPVTPNLIRAYGQRASDISQSPSVNPKGSKTHGPFQEFVGVDGTTIWAAATSGDGAVAVHLLACMLASVWSSSEATSIWEELVAERKKELAGKVDSDEFLAKDFGLVKQIVSKEELLDWDASARAWLRAADKSQTTEKQQIELMRVVKGVHLPVSSRRQVYSSVTEAWKIALETVDKVITGVPHTVRDGAVLAALSAWHLYPDIVVLGTRNEETLQHDNLIGPGGVVTIGLTERDSELRNGVYWSLSLAHLRYYGQPVLTSRSLDSDSSRMTVMELAQTVLGATLACWGLQRREIEEGMSLISLLDEKLRLVVDSAEFQMFDPTWISFLARAVRDYRNSVNEQRQSCERSVYRGYRHPGFLSRGKCSPMGFGRLNMTSLIGTKDGRIEFLRSRISKLASQRQPDFWVIKDEGRDGQHFYNVEPLPSSDNKSAFFDWSKQNIITYSSKTSFTWRHPPPQISGNEPEPQPQHRGRVWNLPKKRQQQPRTSYSNDIEFQFVGGDIGGTALFERVYNSLDSGKSTTYEHFPDLTISEILDYLRKDLLNKKLLTAHISSLGSRIEQRDLCDSLRAIASCMEMYENLPGATISPETITQDRPICALLWASAHRLDTTAALGQPSICHASGASNLSRECAFAAICMLETGTLDLNPTWLKGVMAISSGDSLYIAAPLLCDPATVLQPSDIRRVVGNIGRAGLALMIPPKNPEIRKTDPNMWKLINHNEFQGALEDCFSNTTLHLSFTGYESPLGASDHGSICGCFLHRDQNLRPRFREMGCGHRPSWCSV